VGGTAAGSHTPDERHDRRDRGSIVWSAFINSSSPLAPRRPNLSGQSRSRGHGARLRPRAYNYSRNAPQDLEKLIRGESLRGMVQGGQRTAGRLGGLSRHCSLLGCAARWWKARTHER
jgi:hypothetical protein